MGKRRSEHPLPPPSPPPATCAAAADVGDEIKQQNDVCYYYDPRISYADYGETHAMVPHRVTMTHALIKAYGLLDHMDRLAVAPATQDDLELGGAHDRDYIDFLRGLTPPATTKTTRRDAAAAAAEKYRLGEVRGKDKHGRCFVTHDNPVIDNLWDYSRRYAGGSLAAARALAGGGGYKVAINWSGGMHHACRGNAAGFCYVNDIVVAINALLLADAGGGGRRRFRRVLYLDIDAHHGDGVEAAFAGDSRVLTVSFHQFGGDFFPGTGDAVDAAAGGGEPPTLINVPLEEGTGDEVYHRMFAPIVDRVMAVFRPDAVVMQCGADSLAGDRLAGLGLSVRGHAKCVSIVKGYGLPLLLLGGGGYTINRVASCWCYETAVAVGMEIADDIPQHGYQSYYQSQRYKLHYHKEKEDDDSGRGSEETMVDKAKQKMEMEEKAKQIMKMEENAKQVMEKVMKHLDRLSSEFMMLNMQPGDPVEPPSAQTRRNDGRDDVDALVAVDHSPWDEDPGERLHRCCGEHLLHEFFTDLGRKHPKR